MTNAGLMEASGGGDLFVGRTTVDNQGGTLLAGDGSTVTLDQSVIVGGTLTSTGTGAIVCALDAYASTLDGTSSAVANTGLIKIDDIQAFGNDLAIEGAIANSGTIAVIGDFDTHGRSSLHVLAAGATLSGGGVVNLSGTDAQLRSEPLNAATTLINLDNTISGVGSIGVKLLTLVNDAKGVIDANAPGYLLVNTAAATLTNAGLLTAGDGGVLVLASQTIDQSAGGTIAAQTGGRVNLQGVDVIGGTVTTPGGGVVGATAAGGTLNGTASAVTVAGVLKLLDGTDLTVEGSIDVTGEFSLYGHSTATKLIVAANGANLTGGGQVVLRNNAVNEIVGASPAATLTNADRIVGGGLLGGAMLTLVNQAAGVINGNSTITSLIIDTGAITIENAGQISAASGGSVEIKSALSNTGRIVAASGGTLTLDGAVSGGGLVRINGGTMDFAAAFDGGVAFIGGTGVLELAKSQAYLTGTITGFSTGGGTSLDLGDIAFTQGVTKATYLDNGHHTGGVLTVTDGTHTANLKLAGDFTASVFTTSSDGHGGTTVVDPAAHRFIAAMAAFHPPSLAHAVVSTVPHPSAAIRLAIPIA